jgi:anthranilate/para-aminobenzoate synthase component I
VGSGIVWDSLAAEEYEECRVKSKGADGETAVFPS